MVIVRSVPAAKPSWFTVEVTDAPSNPVILDPPAESKSCQVRFCA